MMLSMDVIAGVPATVTIHHRVGSVPLVSGTWGSIWLALAVICVLGLQVRSVGLLYSRLKAYWSLAPSPSAGHEDARTSEFGSAGSAPSVTAATSGHLAATSFEESSLGEPRLPRNLSSDDRSHPPHRVRA
jgi:hypothetical protein